MALAGGLFLTYWIRFVSGWFPVPQGVPEFASYAAAALVVVPVGLLVIRGIGLYRPHRRTDLTHDLVRGTRALAMTCILLAAIAFFYRGFSFSRTFLVAFGLVSTVLFVGGRRVGSFVHAALRRRGVGIQRVAIVGGGETADRLVEKIRSRPGTGLQVVATLGADEWRGEEAGDSVAERSRRPGRLQSFARSHRLDRLIVTDPHLTYDERLDLVESCHGVGVRCAFVPDLFDVMFGRVLVENIDGIPLVGAKLHPLGRLDRVKKRTLDVVLSGLGLLALSPLLAVMALAVRLDSKGPALYRQRRIGRDGREFDLYKFRSMPMEAEAASGPVRASRGDRRATRVGRILRRTSLDELPQLWNVLKGEMSLVGPRPERQFFVDQYQEEIPRYLERHGVKSGLTGWAQANGLRGNTSIEERTRYDIWYVENWSLVLDVKILFLTLVRFLSQEEAY